MELELRARNQNSSGTGAYKMSNVDLYQSQLRQRQTEIVKRLRVFIALRYPDLAESFKNVPTYSLNGKSIMGLQDFRGHMNLNFFRGPQLRDPRRILQGTGKQVRHVSFRS